MPAMSRSNWAGRSREARWRTAPSGRADRRVRAAGRRHAPSRAPLRAARRRPHSVSSGEYNRNGTLSLYAALNIQTGEVHGKTTARHTSQDFVGFLGDVVATCEPGQHIHVILDNLSAHKTKTVTAFLDEHPNVRLHFTPDLFLVAESRGAVVLEGAAGRAGARHLHVDGGPGQEAAMVYCGLRKAGEAIPLEVCRPHETDPSWQT